MINIPDEKLPKELRPRTIVIFVDGNHLFHRTKYWYGTHNIPINKLSKMICTESRNLIQIRYYYSPFVQTVDQNNYVKQDTYIKKMPKNIELISGNYIKKPLLLPEKMMNKLLESFKEQELYTYVEKGIDVNIAVDMVSMAHQNFFQDMVLISGDADFVPAITQVRNLHKRVQVAAYRDEENSCEALSTSSTSFINLHKIINKILQRERRKPQPKGCG